MGRVPADTQPHCPPRPNCTHRAREEETAPLLGHHVRHGPDGQIAAPTDSGLRSQNPLKGTPIGTQPHHWHACGQTVRPHQGASHSDPTDWGCRQAIGRVCLFSGSHLRKHWISHHREFGNMRLHRVVQHARCGVWTHLPPTQR